MAELPFMQLVPAEYLADTTHLTTEEHGAYLLLIMHYWLRGEALPDDDMRLSRITKLSKTRWKNMRPVIEEFFVSDGVLWQHKRIEADLLKTRVKVEAKMKAGRASARARNLRKNSINSRSAGQQVFDTRSTHVQHTSNEQATNYNQNISPYPLTENGSEDAPAPSGGRASPSGGGAKSIGCLIENKVPKNKKGRSQ